MKLKKFFHASAGFTLIEIVVTLAIIAIIFSVAANGFNRSNSESNVRSATELLASDLRAAALYALNSEQFQLQAPNGWGIYFDLGTETYTIFADLDNDRVYDTNEKFKSTTLGRNVSISAVCFSACGTINGSVYFSTADVVPYYDNIQITNATGDLTIDIIDAVTSTTKVIAVNAFAAVTIE